MNRSLVFTFSGYSGIDVLAAILPKSWQTKRVARAWLKALGDVDLETTVAVIQMPWGSFRIIDKRGNAVRVNYVASNQ